MRTCFSLLSNKKIKPKKVKKMVKCDFCGMEAKYSFDGVRWMCNRCAIQALVESEPLFEISDLHTYEKPTCFKNGCPRWCWTQCPEKSECWDHWNKNYTKLIIQRYALNTWRQQVCRNCSSNETCMSEPDPMCNITDDEVKKCVKDHYDALKFTDEEVKELLVSTAEMNEKVLVIPAPVDNCESTECNPMKLLPEDRCPDCVRYQLMKHDQDLEDELDAALGVETVELDDDFEEIFEDDFDDSLGKFGMF